MGNMRLIMENFMKYGVLIKFGGGGFNPSDVKFGTILYASIPLELFISYAIEHFAALQAKASLGKAKKSDGKVVPQKAFWGLISFLHALNATVWLVLANYIVYYHIHAPLVGTACEFHAGKSILMSCRHC